MLGKEAYSATFELGRVGSDTSCRIITSNAIGRLWVKE